MGCDIHLMVEKRNKIGFWEFIPVEPQSKEDWDRDRNYKCFAILANVRNGYGFAGIPTGEGFVPISEPRGIPKDASKEVKKAQDPDWKEDDCDWLGDHSFSYLTLKELLNYDWNQETVVFGVVSLEQFLENRNSTEPIYPHSAGISGPGIITIEQEDIEAKLATKNGYVEPVGITTCVRMKWKVKYKDAAGRFYSNFIPRLQELCNGDDPSNVRITFGFDS